MRQHPSTRLAAALCAAGLLALAGPAAAQAPYTGLFVIGDSLSDNGNLFAASGFPPAPYFQGRFSNGLVAADVLATGLGVFGTAAYVNVAIGGARTGDDGEAAANTGMRKQTEGLLARLPALPSGALYMVWGGANDLRNNVTIGEAVGNLTSILTSLHDAGARNFLLPNMPDLGLTPEARERGSFVAGVATAASNAFNLALANAYGTLAQQWTDETFYTFDAIGAQRTITSGSPANGFTDVSTRCYDFRNPLAPTLCANPGSYLYWDNIHPTASAHAILGAQMLAAVTAVPEPATMLMLGVGVVGLLGLQRRRAHGAAA